MSIYDLPVGPITARGKAAGVAIYALARRGKMKVADVADKLDVRAQILRDIAPAVGQSTTGRPLDLPVARQRNLEWAADEIETAAELIRRFGNAIPKTAEDAMNAEEVKELRAYRAFLLDLVRKQLSPQQVHALDALIEWRTAAMLAETLEISVAQAGNLCSLLHRIGLLERKLLPVSGPGRSPAMYRTADVVHGPERHAAQIEAIRAKAREIQDERESK